MIVPICLVDIWAYLLLFLPDTCRFLELFDNRKRPFITPYLVDERNHIDTTTECDCIFFGERCNERLSKLLLGVFHKTTLHSETLLKYFYGTLQLCAFVRQRKNFLLQLMRRLL